MNSGLETLASVGVSHSSAKNDAARKWLSQFSMLGRTGSGSNLDPDVERMARMLCGDALAGQIAMVLEATHLRLRIVDAVFSLALAA